VYSNLFELVFSLSYDLLLAPLHIGHWLCIDSAKPAYTASGLYTFGVSTLVKSSYHLQHIHND
jgi:hypothetical protein